MLLNPAPIHDVFNRYMDWCRVILFSMYLIVPLVRNSRRFTKVWQAVLAERLFILVNQCPV